MLQFRGEPAHSHFRLQKLLQQIIALNPFVTAIDSHYWYFCSARGELNDQQIDSLRKLLNVDSAQQAHQPPSGEFFWCYHGLARFLRGQVRQRISRIIVV